jgi:hypothetical protein
MLPVAICKGSDLLQGRRIAMKKIRIFFYALLKTFTSPAYYVDILKAPFSFSLKYFLVFSLLAAIVVTAVIALPIHAPVTTFMGEIPGLVVKAFPDELELTIRNGELSTNVKEPYAMPISAVTGVANSEQFKNLVVIDTSGKVDDFYRYDTLALATKKFFVTYSDNEMKLYPVQDMGNAVITKGSVQNIVGALSPYLKYVFPALATMIFVGVLVGVPLLSLFYLLLFSLVGLVVFKIVRLPHGYGKAYQVGLHLITVTSTLMFIHARIGSPLGGVPLLGPLVYAGLFVVVALSARQQEVTPPDAALQPPTV